MQQWQHPEKPCHSALWGTAHQTADNGALAHPGYPVVPEGSHNQLRARERTTCLLSTSATFQVSFSLSLSVFSFVLPRATVCIFPANLLLLFPGNLSSLCRFCILFCYPWHGGTLSRPIRAELPVRYGCIYSSRELALDWTLAAASCQTPLLPPSQSCLSCPLAYGLWARI